MRVLIDRNSLHFKDKTATLETAVYEKASTYLTIYNDSEKEILVVAGDKKYLYDLLFDLSFDYDIEII